MPLLIFVSLQLAAYFTTNIAQTCTSGSLYSTDMVKGNVGTEENGRWYLNSNLPSTCSGQVTQYEMNLFPLTGSGSTTFHINFALWDPISDGSDTYELNTESITKLSFTKSASVATVSPSPALYTRKGAIVGVYFDSLTNERAPIYGELAGNNLCTTTSNSVTNTATVDCNVQAQTDRAIRVQAHITVIDCSPIPTVPNSMSTQVPDGDTQYGANVTYSCNEGYQHTAGDLTLQCNESSAWSGTVPECSIITCPTVTIDNGTSTATDSNNYQSVVSFSCDTGFELNGTSSITCQINGNWNDTVPTCSIVNCGDPGDPPANGSIVTSNPSFEYESVIVYECDDGFTFPSNNYPVIQCTDTGQWNSTVPTCVQSSTAPSSTTVSTSHSTVVPTSNLITTTSSSSVMAISTTNSVITTDSSTTMSTMMIVSSTSAVDTSTVDTSSIKPMSSSNVLTTSSMIPAVPSTTSVLPTTSGTMPVAPTSSNNVITSSMIPSTTSTSSVITTQTMSSVISTISSMMPVASTSSNNVVITSSMISSKTSASSVISTTSSMMSSVVPTSTIVISFTTSTTSIVPDVTSTNNILTTSATMLTIQTTKTSNSIDNTVTTATDSRSSAGQSLTEGFSTTESTMSKRAQTPAASSTPTSSTTQSVSTGGNIEDPTTSSALQIAVGVLAVAFVGLVVFVLVVVFLVLVIRRRKKIRKIKYSIRNEELTTSTAGLINGTTVTYRERRETNMQLCNPLYSDTTWDATQGVYEPITEFMESNLNDDIPTSPDYCDVEEKRQLEGTFPPPSFDSLTFSKSGINALSNGLYMLEDSDEVVQRPVTDDQYFELEEVQEPAFAQEPIYWHPESSSTKIYDQLARRKYREISREKLIITEHLGSGQYGSVEKGVWQSSKGPIDVAIKTLKGVADEEDEVKFLQEAAINGQFHHPNVVQLFGVVTVGKPTLIVLEYIPNGDLKEFLEKRRPMPGELTDDNFILMLIKFSHQVASGMVYLAKKRFIHRDIAARNILVGSNYVCKIADFGMSRDLQDESYYRSNSKRIPVKWTAPEAIHYRKYTTESDVWSFGALLYEIWSVGYKPFQQYSNQECLDMVDEGYRLAAPPGCGRSVYKLMIKCWNPKPSDRPSFEDLQFELSKGKDIFTETVPLKADIGGPIHDDRSLYPDLQNIYMENREEDSDDGEAT